MTCPVCGSESTVTVDYRLVVREPGVGPVYPAACVCGARLGIVADENDVAKMVPIQVESSHSVPSGPAG